MVVLVNKVGLLEMGGEEEETDKGDPQGHHPTSWIYIHVYIKLENSN